MKPSRETKAVLTEYDRAIRQMSDEVLRKKTREYEKYINTHISPLKQKLGILRMMQTVKVSWKEGQWVENVKWKPESKVLRDKIQAQVDLHYEIAESRFWVDYEHLRPNS